MTETEPNATVLVTGAAGRNGRELFARLPGLGWTLRGLDRRPAESSTVGDIRAPGDLDAAVPGVDAIVHLAGQATEAPWQVIREANIEGCFQVFEAARRHGVSLVVYASSVHAVGFAEVAADLPPDVAARPDTLYGVSKVFGETLGRYYADRYGLRVVCLRIVTFAETVDDPGTLATWLSPADCARLVDAALRDTTPGCRVVWGVSDNTRGTWSLTEGRELGHRPVDDAETYAGALPGPTAYPSDHYAGGGYTASGFGIDEVAARWA